tara:strand:+ start:266 stop:484 length:219 start_codon:yes stop_codon:yes gene_type:complete
MAKWRTDMVDREAAAQLNQSIVDLQKRCNDLAIKASRAAYEERSNIADWLCDEGHEELGLAVLDEKYKEDNQ